MTEIQIHALHDAAMAAGRRWQEACATAGVNIWRREAGMGALGVLLAEKVAAYDAWRAAAFPHASR